VTRRNKHALVRRPGRVDVAVAAVVFVTVEEGKGGLLAPGALGRLDLSRREYR
jgi:hypothetical protein